MLLEANNLTYNFHKFTLFIFYIFLLNNTNVDKPNWNSVNT